MSHAAVLVVPMIEVIQREGSIKAAVEWEMLSFSEEEWFGDGSRWDWYVIGGRFDGLLGGKNVVQMKELSIEAVRKQREGWIQKAYKSYTERPNNPFSDVQENESLEDYIARKLGDKNPLHTYAFLRNRHWHEAERMGWFGGTTYTECERKDLDKPVADPENWFGKCLYKNESMGSQVVCWNEPEEIWGEQFYRRFINPLKPEDTLVVVDYHV
jgi:hypothetical protein